MKNLIGFLVAMILGTPLLGIHMDKEKFVFGREEQTNISNMVINEKFSKSSGFELAPDLIAFKVIDINDKQFFFVGKDIFDNDLNIINTEGIDLGSEDGLRMQALLNTFGVNSNEQVLIDVYNFNANNVCDSCTVNRTCKLNSGSGCKPMCNWNAGYKCCSNERGSTCHR